MRPSALQVTPSALELGRVAVGGVVRRIVTVRNKGDSAAVLRPITIDPELAGELRLVGVPEQIPAGATRELGVVYAPRSAGLRRGRLTIDVVGTASTSVFVRADVVEEALELSPASVDFGPVPIGELRTATVALAFRGADQLELATATVLGDPGFRVGVVGPRRLFPGEVQRIEVLFEPTDVGPASAEVFFGAGERVFGPLSLRGDAVAAAIALEPEDSQLGAVVVGDSKPHRLRLVSRAERAERVILAVRGAVAAFPGIEAVAGVVVLAAGDDRVFDLAFAPLAAGTASVTVTAEVEGAPARLIASISGVGATDPDAPLVFDPPSVALGPVEVGAIVRRSLWLVNGSPISRVIVGSPEVSPADVPLALDAGSPGSVMRGGDRRRVALELSPSAVGAGAATVRVAGASLAVAWTGVARPVRSIAAPGRVDLGVWVGEPRVDRRAIELEGTGTTTAAVTATVTGPGAAAFAVAFDGASGNRVAPGGRLAITVEPGRAPPRRAEATLRLTTDDPGAVAQDVALSVAAGPAPPRARVFCASAAGVPVEIHAVPLDAVLGDAPFAGSACTALVRDDRGDRWAIGAPGAGATCAMDLDGSGLGSVLLAVTTPPVLAGSVLVEVTLDGVPLATRWMGGGQRWTVGWARMGLELLDVPLVPAGPTCF